MERVVSLSPSDRSGPSWRNGVDLLAEFVRIDRRRPASWITLASGAWLGWCCSRPSSNAFAVLASAATLAVAAIGDLPLAVCRPAGGGVSSAWAWERSSWPMAGVILGVIAARGGLPHVSVDGLLPVVVGCGFATATLLACRLSAIRPADAASLTLLVAAASGACGACIASRSRLGLLGAAGVWLLLGGVCRRWAWSPAAGIDGGAIQASREPFGDGVGALKMDAFPAGGALRHALVRLSMVGGLLVMAMWLLVEPQVGEGARAVPLAGLQGASATWALFIAACFVGLAVPQATLQDGVASAAAWDRLFRTAARTDHAGRSAEWPRRPLQPGSVRFAAGVVIAQAAILGWPIIVSMVLSLSTPAKARAALGIAAGLAVLAAMVMVIVAFGAVVRASRETTFAVVLAIVAGLLAIALAGTPPVPQSARRTLPWPRSLACLPGLPGLAGLPARASLSGRRCGASALADAWWRKPGAECVPFETSRFGLRNGGRKHDNRES